MSDLRVYKRFSAFTYADVKKKVLVLGIPPDLLSSFDAGLDFLIPGICIRVQRALHRE